PSAGGATVLNVRGPSEQIRLGAPTRSRLSLSRPADRGAGGQDCEARRGEVQRTLGASDQRTSRQEHLERALDRLHAVHAPATPMGADPAATRCGEMVE